jgi:L-ascorbate metabolism protein UlaG (beta-lactamase superfamily)
LVFVRWHGHSCFEIRDSATVLTDPHDGKMLGLPVPSCRPDAVLISHHHDDHANGLHLFEGPGVVVLDEPCETQVKGVEIRGIEAYHDDVGGSRLGENVVFAFEVGGVRFSHLGDLGHVLSAEQLEGLGSVDILFSGMGRDLELAGENVRLIEPRIVIPMHYWVEGIIFPWFQLAMPEDFVKEWPYVRWVDGPEMEYSPDSLPGRMELHVFRI